MDAAIDIGTNTALLLVAEYEDGAFNVLEEQQRIPRLGTGVDESKMLSAEAMDRTIASLKEFKQILDEKYPSINNPVVTATSAVRDAENRKSFINLVKLVTGFDIALLNGTEEARYTFAGAQSVLLELKRGYPKLVIDIGGGSTEIAYGRRSLENRYSYDMGCVRYTERYLKADPPTQEQIHHCRESIRATFKEYKFNVADKTVLIGVAGTVTSLAYIDKGLSYYDNDKLAGHKISQDTLQNYIVALSNESSKEFAKRYPEVMKGRADIFLAGLLILDEFMNLNNIAELITSTGGIRHGAILLSK